MSVNAPPPRGWNERARRLAWTVLFLAFALSFAANVLRAIVPMLIVAAAVGGVLYVGVLIARYRRSRW